MDFWNSVEIPNAWKVTKLNNICDLYTGNSISESIKNSKYTNLKDGYNYIATKDVKFDNSIDYD